MSDVVILLGLLDLVGLFCLYEEAAIQGVKVRGRRLHTISWWASWHPVLRVAITLLFLAGGIGGAVWFAVFHALPGHIPG